MSGIFDKQKVTCLSAVDLSRKGSVDGPIVDLVQYINSQDDYFTTSSCSGRSIVVDNDINGHVKKQGCKWLLTSHAMITSDQLRDSVVTVDGNAVFKFEPFVMHVQCRNLQDAQTLLSCAVASGYRNSGVSVGNKGKFITAIRSTQSLEVPLTCKGSLMVDQKYLDFLVDTANGKMEENLLRIDRFYQNFKQAVETNGENNKPSKAAIKAQRAKEKKENHQSFVKESLTLKDIDNENQEVPDCVEDLVQCSIFDSDFDT